jgi:hypothetical protein
VLSEDKQAVEHCSGPRLGGAGCPAREWPSCVKGLQKHALQSGMYALDAVAADIRTFAKQP